MAERRYWDDLTVGTVLWGNEVTADREEMLDYALKNDPLPFHVDEAAAVKSHFKGLVASGGYTITLWFRSCIPVMGSIAFLAGHEFTIELPIPVRAGDRLRTRFDIIEQVPSSKPGRGHIVSRQRLINQDEGEALICQARWLISARPQ